MPFSGSSRTNEKKQHLARAQVSPDRQALDRRAQQRHSSRPKDRATTQQTRQDTKNNARQTNQHSHSLRGNDSAARRALAPARNIAPVRGRELFCWAARTPRALMSQRGATPCDNTPHAAPHAVPTPGRALPHHCDGPGKNPRLRHDGPNGMTAEGARVARGQGRIGGPLLVAFSE